MVSEEVAYMPKPLINFLIDADLLREIDEAAAEDGLTRSAWLRDALRAKLRWRKLTQEQREAIMAGVGDD